MGEPARIELLALHKLVDLDGPRRFQRDVLELFLGHLDEGVGVDLEALDDVLVGDFRRCRRPPWRI
jgi:hypothetical protein